MGATPPLCVACGRREVIWPVLVCWYCRQDGVPVPAAHRRPRGRGIRPFATRRRWTPQEDRQLRRAYPESGPQELLALLPGRPIGAIYQRAYGLGLKKDAAYLEAKRAEEAKRLTETGARHRFPRGHVPANKGMKGRPSTGRMAETQFKKGQMAGAAQEKWRPVGTVVTDRNGYRKVKVSDDPAVPSRHNWRFCHVLLWEQHHGPVPTGHAVAFKDGRKDHVAIENLELLSRAELMARNSIHSGQIPEDLLGVIRQIGALRRRITCKESNRGKRKEEEGHRGAARDAVQGGRAAGGR